MNKLRKNLILINTATFLAVFSAHLFAKDIYITPTSFKSLWNTINPGDKVIFAAGEYREEMRIQNNKPWSASFPTTFVAQTPGKVIVKGSDIVKDWIRIDDTHYYKHWPSESSQVFIDGNQLRQLGGTVFDGFPDNPASAYLKLHRENGGQGIWPGRVNFNSVSSMPLNSFYYDKNLRKLIICVTGNPVNKKVEVSVRRPFFLEGMNGVILDGLVFEHSNNSMIGRGSAVKIIGDDNIIRNIKVLNADLVGVGMVGNRNQLLNSIIKYSGQLGVTMKGLNNKIVGNESSYNNTRGFNKWWEAGGFKFIGNGGLKNSEFIKNTAQGNIGDGVWFDSENKNNIIRENNVAYNTGFGIHYEISKSGLIQYNYIYGNGQRGIYLRDSANSVVKNNIVVGNGLEGVVAVYTGQKDNTGVVFGAENLKVNSNIIGWNKGGALIMPKGALNIGTSDANVYLGSENSFKFSLGFPSPNSLPVYSLSDWRSIFKLDTMSVFGIAPIPKDISDKLTAKLLINDWTSLNKLAVDLKSGQ